MTPTPRGDILTLGVCNNPSGWTSVFRNGKPIHHFAHSEIAKEFFQMIVERTGGKTTLKED